MTRRRGTLLLIATGVVLLFGVLPYVFFHPRRLNHDGYAAIQNGMTQNEVEELLGGPPGIYYPTHPGAGAGMTLEGYDVPDAVEVVWYDDKKRYEIWFSEDGRVVGKHKRSHWYATTHTCRLTGWLFGRSEQTPLEPKRYQKLPAAR